MGWLISIVDERGNTVEMPEGIRHHIACSNMVVGGATSFEMSITYNYGKFYRDVMGKDGINSIHGKKLEEVITVLNDAIRKLKPNKTKNYWDATEGNARQALIGLLNLCRVCPDKNAVLEVL